MSLFVVIFNYFLIKAQTCYRKLNAECPAEEKCQIPRTSREPCEKLNGTCPSNCCSIDIGDGSEICFEKAVCPPVSLLNGYTNCTGVDEGDTCIFGCEVW